MRYLVLATDYDGTIAAHGAVAASTIEALERARASGRKLVLVTGRELEDLFGVFPQYGLFDRIVAENGALLYRPDTREEKKLGESPPAALVEQLRALDVPISVGRVILATREPHEHAVLEGIHALGLEHQVIFNKGAVMVLPAGVNKATGLRAALAELSLSAHNTVAVGDAENDHALLAECELGVAVANALPMLKERADWVTEGARGAGVEELIAELVESDLRRFAERLKRADLTLGKCTDGAPLSVHAHGQRLLLCGTSGSGKSTLTTAFLEQLCEKKYQFCLIDPEGDYDSLPGAVGVGNEQQAPRADEVLELLTTNENSVIVNLLGIKLEERPAFFTELFARLTEYRARFGRPHWIIVDEAHHMLPAGEVKLPEFVAHPPSGLMLITVHPEHVAHSVLDSVDALIVVGSAPAETIAGFATARGVTAPSVSHDALSPGHALFFHPGRGELMPFEATPPSGERRRHHRKYAAGTLGEDKSFYFRGPRQKLNLRAQNLGLFMQLADGVDDETWLHHLRQHDYSHWLREAIKNDELASEVEAIESDAGRDARKSRERVRSAIERVYTLPA
jgi:hydroxymethylpyrimidine pyrophosphatase-like HAD family hydrolase/energy-coupling factor transporter ATP-binding protein EcfA2